MTIRNLMITTLAISMLATSASADTVDAANVTTFVPNTPSRASEVNVTVQALITAINDNANRIADIEAAVQTNEVAGESYFFVALEIGAAEIGVDDVGGVGTEGSGFSNLGTVTFDSVNGTASLTSSAFEFFSSNAGVSSQTLSNSGTFSFMQTGSDLVLTDIIDGEEIIMQLSPSGEIGIGRLNSGVNSGVGALAEASAGILIAIRQ